MNTWYNLYKEAFRNPFDIATRDITKYLDEKVREGAKGQIWVPSDIITNFDEITGKSTLKRVGANIDRQALKTDAAPPYIVMGSFLPDEGGAASVLWGGLTTIDIYINDAKFGPEYYNDFHVELASAVRHELEHGADEYRRKKKGLPFRPSYSVEDLQRANKEENVVNIAIIREKYVTDILEREAFIRGAMTQAKKRKKPLVEFLQNFLLEALVGKENVAFGQQVMARGGPAGQRLLDIIGRLSDRYISRVKEIYPHLK